MTLKRLIVLTLLAALPAFAQEPPPRLEPIPEPPPPPPGMADTAEPEVTITTRGEDKVEEYRINGRLYMIKVTPKVGAPYYLVDHKGDGVFSPAEASERGLSVPMWLIKSW